MCRYVLDSKCRDEPCKNGATCKQDYATGLVSCKCAFKFKGTYCGTGAYLRRFADVK